MILVCCLGRPQGMRVLDVGCGVGGPMRNMAIFSGSNIDGITINQYQVRLERVEAWMPTEGGGKVHGLRVHRLSTSNSTLWMNKSMGSHQELSVAGCLRVSTVQVNIGNKYNKQMGLDHLCKLHRGDFQVRAGYLDCHTQ